MLIESQELKKAKTEGCERRSTGPGMLRQQSTAKTFPHLTLTMKYKNRSSRVPSGWRGFGRARTRQLLVALALSSSTLGACSDREDALVEFSTGGTTPSGASNSGGSGELASGGFGQTGGAQLNAGGSGSGGEPPPGSGGSGLGGSGGGVTQSGGSSGSSGSGGALAGDGGASTGGGSDPGTPSNAPLINGLLWADTEGQPIQAHGGGMLKVGSDYYWFGENRNPDGTFYAVSAYRSRDLRHWEHAHDVLTMETDGGLDPANVERPKVVYNESTGKYVMWMHWENGEHYGEARAAVASSDTVDGDYTYHGSFRPFQDSGVMDHDRPGYMSRDCTLFVDDDGAAYFLSAANENYDLHLYRLSEDYLSIAEFEGKLFEGDHREAPALFKRNGIYFLVTSGSTGWDPNQAKYATSTSLTSGWSNLKNVANETTFYSQSTYVQPIQGTDGTEYLYMGDRWAGAWGGRVNDSLYLWQPIAFADDTTMSMDWYNTLQLDADRGHVSGSMDHFVFVNERSEMVLSVDGPADENGTDLVQQPLESAQNHIWKLDYDGAGFFHIQNVAGGTIIDVPDESTSSGVDLHLWEDNGGDHQTFGVIDLGGGRYQLRNKKSGLFVGISDGSTQSSARIQQQDGSGGPEQVWRIRVAE